MIESLMVSAESTNWCDVYDFIVQYFSNYSISKKDILNMSVSAEEIFSNIICHSKSKHGSNIEISVDYMDIGRLMVVKFKYGGVEFNPSEVSVPDVKISLDKRNPGGLGLLIVKRFTDSITYKRSRGTNILEISKKAASF